MVAAGTSGEGRPGDNKADRTRITGGLENAGRASAVLTGRREDTAVRTALGRDALVFLFR